MLQTLYLKRNEDRRLRAGHLWIYSNEVDIARSPLKAMSAGQMVQVRDSKDTVLGIAYVNPAALICGRLLQEKSDTVVDEAWFEARLEKAAQLRDALFGRPFYRLCYGESDFIPGLVIDRFGDYFVAQINTAGMEQFKSMITDVLVKMYKPKGIMLKNTASTRQQEGLENYTEVVYGEIPETIELEENGLRYITSLLSGQKTGWFYDHRVNRHSLRQYCHNARVLDMFCYTGAWSMNAAAAGAAKVTAVDVSAPALDNLQKSATLNQFSDRIETVNGDVFDVLEAMKRDGTQFDCIVLDPPAFAKRKKDLENGVKAYYRVNKLAMELLAPGGYLVTASCSFHMAKEQLLREVLRASRHLNRAAQVVAQGSQGQDHPIHPAISETEYLKTFFVRVL